MFCPKCGTKLPDDENTRFCDNCGALLESRRKATPAKVASPKQINAAGFINTALSNFVQSSLVLALIGIVSTLMPWVSFAQTKLGRGVMNFLGIEDKLNVFQMLSIQTDSKILVFLLMFAIPIAGLVLAIISFVKKNEAQQKYEKLGKNALLVMGIGGIITFVLAFAYVSGINNEASVNLAGLAIGSYIWFICSILQIVLFVLVKKNKQVH